MFVNKRVTDFCTSHHNTQFLPTCHAGNRTVRLKNKATIHHSNMKLIIPISRHPVRGKQGQDRHRQTNPSSPHKLRKRLCQCQLLRAEIISGTAGQRPLLQHSHTGGHDLPTVCFLGIKAFLASAVSPGITHTPGGVSLTSRILKSCRHEF